MELNISNNFIFKKAGYKTPVLADEEK